MHSDILNIKEHEAHRPHVEFLKRIDQAGNPDYVILDWGCGRGSDVLHFRRSGFKAFGAEISKENISRGKKLFGEFGFDQESVIKLIQPNNKTDFPDSFFDIVISYQVFEHVKDLESVAKEMYRIMKPESTGIHVYPGHRHFFEGHLFMPIVHWLPKNSFRRSIIRIFTSLGIEPRWKELSSFSDKEKADRYFDYSIKQTFYRKPCEVVKIFNNAGFRAKFESHKHDRIVRRGLDKIIPARLLSWVLTNFFICVLVIRKS